MPDDRLDRNFRTDLDQLAGVADRTLPALGDQIQLQLAAHNKFDGVTPPSHFPGVEAAFYGLNDVLKERLKRACTVIEATGEAVHDIANLYKRADGQ
ncbi:hypothetical protein [Alloactinosynnema sp. L-07]|uniref:hypothetical protein n=1 Tax=Alloactinosynnema sp. L-07 TaxID=1653480 RepID=UPI00065EF7C2|nr:hypothetical protein [Alloactinosynnema sp. L-07]CRK61656.1 hypothetical protein [Alloactinosynnema sp. L-07]